MYFTYASVKAWRRFSTWVSACSEAPALSKSSHKIRSSQPWSSASSLCKWFKEASNFFLGVLSWFSALLRVWLTAKSIYLEITKTQYITQYSRCYWLGNRKQYILLFKLLSWNILQFTKVYFAESPTFDPMNLYSYILDYYFCMFIVHILKRVNYDIICKCVKVILDRTSIVRRNK